MLYWNGCTDFYYNLVWVGPRLCKRMRMVHTDNTCTHTNHNMTLAYLRRTFKHRCAIKGNMHPCSVLGAQKGLAERFFQCIGSVCLVFVIAPPILLGVRREFQVASLWFKKVPQPTWVLRFWPYGRVSTSLEDVCSHTRLHVEMRFLGGRWLLLLFLLLHWCFCLCCKKEKENLDIQYDLVSMVTKGKLHQHHMWNMMMSLWKPQPKQSVWNQVLDMTRALL